LSNGEQVKRAIVDGRGGAAPDYLLELFEYIELARTSHRRLSAGFALFEASLAALVTVSLDNR
jgi:hypothetical protein